MASEVEGRAAGVAAERAAELLAPSQGDLLGLPQTPRSRELEARRGPGRPPGSRNKRAEDVARFIVEEIGDPLVRLAVLAAMPAEELAAKAGCSVMEALVEQRLAAIAVLPFVHQRKPVSVDVTNHRAVHLTIQLGDDVLDAGGAPEIVGILENQGVDDDATGAV